MGSDRQNESFLTGLRNAWDAGFWNGSNALGQANPYSRLEHRACWEDGNTYGQSQRAKAEAGAIQVDWYE